jgi:hypothetical protein
MTGKLWLAWIGSVLLGFLVGYLVSVKYEKLGFTLFGDNGVFRGKRNEGSYTRVIPFLLIVVAVLIWVAGVYVPDIAAYATSMIDKIIELAKWTFGLGKGSEEISGIGKPAKAEE